MAVVSSKRVTSFQTTDTYKGKKRKRCRRKRKRWEDLKKQIRMTCKIHWRRRPPRQPREQRRRRRWGPPVTRRRGSGDKGANNDDERDCAWVLRALGDGSLCSSSLWRARSFVTGCLILRPPKPYSPGRANTYDCTLSITFTNEKRRRRRRRRRRWNKGATHLHAALDSSGLYAEEREAKGAKWWEGRGMGSGVSKMRRKRGKEGQGGKVRGQSNETEWEVKRINEMGLDEEGEVRQRV